MNRKVKWWLNVSTWVHSACLVKSVLPFCFLNRSLRLSNFLRFVQKVYRLNIGILDDKVLSVTIHKWKYGYYYLQFGPPTYFPNLFVPSSQSLFTTGLQRMYESLWLTGDRRAVFKMLVYSRHLRHWRHRNSHWCNERKTKQPLKCKIIQRIPGLKLVAKFIKLRTASDWYSVLFSRASQTIRIQ